MTQQEFSERTGLHPTDEKFKFINDLYMYCGTLDKDEFCLDYKAHGNSHIIYDLMDTIEAKTKAYDNVFNAYEAFRNERYNRELALATVLLGKAAAYNDTDLEREALQLVSRDTAILIKINEGYQLTDYDFAYIANNLI
jgi:hypothetical protein